MKIFIINWLFMVIVVGLAAQTQTLPDLKVEGESEVQSFLYKRSLLFAPIGSGQDSLPAFVPQGIISNLTENAPAGSKNRGFIQFEANAEFGLNSFFSYYPRDSALHSITNFMELYSPDSNYLSFQSNLFVGIDISPTYPISARSSYLSSTAHEFRNSNLELGVAHHRAKAFQGGFELNDLGLQLTFNSIRQSNLAQNYNRNYFDFLYSGRIESGVIDVKSKFIVQGGEGGVQIAPFLLTEPFGISQLRMSFIGDAYHFIPSLDFLYRRAVADAVFLSIDNNTAIEANKFSTVFEQSPWISFDDSHKLQKTPLNLRAAIELLQSPREDFSLARLLIQNTTRYIVDQPLLTSSANLGVAAAVYTDVVENISSVQAFFRQDELSLHQNISLNLGYLPKNSLYRVGYRPALSIDSQFRYPYQDWVFNMDFLQRYFTKDHFGRNLPEAIILNVGAEYHKGNYAIYAQLGNLLNQKTWIFVEQPASMANLYLGFKHRF